MKDVFLLLGPNGDCLVSFGVDEGEVNVQAMTTEGDPLEEELYVTREAARSMWRELLNRGFTRYDQPLDPVTLDGRKYLPVGDFLILDACMGDEGVIEETPCGDLDILSPPGYEAFRVDTYNPEPTSEPPPDAPVRIWFRAIEVPEAGEHVH